jgi:hypothetical protein
MFSFFFSQNVLRLHFSRQYVDNALSLVLSAMMFCRHDAYCDVTKVTCNISKVLTHIVIKDECLFGKYFVLLHVRKL